MRNFILIIFVYFVLSLISCNTCSTNTNINNSINNTELLTDSTPVIYGMSMFNAYEKTLTEQQFNQLCKIEQISNNLSKWHLFISKDAETKEIFKEYMYIKSIGLNEAIFRLIIEDSIHYQISKRIIKE